MSCTSEALYLPALFLTVALLGGLRIADRVLLLPPPLFALVLGLLLLGVMVRSGALAIDRLMSASRPALANLNGLAIIVTTFFASAQAFNLSTPEAGLPRVLCSVFLLVLLLNTLAASPDRVRVLRSLLVIFGSAFTLKFIVLAALSDSASGVVKRALLAMVEGLTLGTLTQDVFRPATGYIAFFTLVLFMVGLALLPSLDRTSPTLVGARPPARRELPQR
jgi:hypothetical protein